MIRFFNRDDFSDLESELRESRPEPREELLDELVSRVQRVPTRVPTRRRPRFAAALVFSVVVLVALAAFGGVGYAKSSLVSAARSSGHVVTVMVNGGDGKQNFRQRGNAGRSDKPADNGNGSENQGQSSDTGGGNSADAARFSGRGDDDEDNHSPPWMHQYSRYVVICYPFRFRNRTFYRTIVVPRLFLGYFVPPGTLGRCVLGPQP